MRFSLLILVAAVSTPAIAQDAPSTTPPDKKICKTITPTGTIMGKRFCLTKTEWRQLNDINERNADLVANGRRINIPTNAER